MLDFSSVAYSLGGAIPFLFVLGVIYGSLEVAGVFKNRAVNFIIAVAFSFMAISNYTVIEFISGIIPYATIVFIIIFGIMFLKRTVFAGIGKGKGGEEDYSLPLIILMFIFIFIANVNTVGIVPPYIGTFLSNQDTLAIIGMSIVLAILYIAYKKKPGY